LTEYTQSNITDKATWTPPSLKLSFYPKIGHKLDELIRKCCSAEWQFRPLMDAVVTVLERLPNSSKSNSSSSSGSNKGVNVGSLTYCPKQQPEITESKEPSAKSLPTKDCFSGRNMDVSFFETPKKRGPDESKDSANKKSKQERKNTFRNDCIDKEEGPTDAPTLRSAAPAGVALFPVCLPDDAAIDVGEKIE
jgi:hypothetical protein